jgi:hypothetical protein
MEKRRLQVKFNVCRFEKKSKEDLINIIKERNKLYKEQMRNLKKMNKDLFVRVQKLEEVLFNNDKDKYICYKQMFKEY